MSFKGPSFEDHGIELNVLTELIQYKRILIETAKELWRKRHPERERLPKGFEEIVRIKFYEICASSAAIPLYREIEYKDNQILFDFEAEDELFDAANLIESGFDSINSDDPLPAEFPKNVTSDNVGFERQGSLLMEMSDHYEHSPGSVQFTLDRRLLEMVEQLFRNGGAGNVPMFTWLIMQFRPSRQALVYFLSWQNSWLATHMDLEHM
ncbi:MAG: hypothetical protein GY816_01975 [Cytophagales bacterium]|nr:hypothetical protein [Cytophagales bacterium]